MHLFRRLLAISGVLVGGLTAAMPAMAQTTANTAKQPFMSPHPWQFGMQTAHSPVEHGVHNLNSLVTWLMFIVTLFVAGLLLTVAYRFSNKRHPVASRTSHNTVLEVAWTLIPVLILVVIAIPSFRLIYFEDRARDPDMTIKVTGHQWYWEYTYPDQGKIDFTSYMVPNDQLKPGQLRLLDVDNQLVLPAGKTVRILITSGDVIHSFFIPSLGVQRYAIPGHTIETWAKIDVPGEYRGECNQICGTNHSFMPISIHAVTPQQFTEWVAQAKVKFAGDAPPPSAPQTDATRPIAVAQVQP